MVIVQGLLLVAVAFMVLDTMFALSDIVSSETSPSKARQRVKAGLNMGGGEEKAEADEFWQEEQEIIEDFTNVEEDLSDVESAKYDLEKEFEAYKEYISQVNQLRSDLAHVINHTDFNSLEERDRFVKRVVKPAVESIESLNDKFESSNPVHNVYDALLNAIQDRVEDANTKVDDLRGAFQDEIETLQEALRNVDEDKNKLDADDLEEIEREDVTQHEARNIINTNQTELSQLNKTDQKLDRIAEELDDLSNQNQSITELESDIDEYIKGVRKELGDYSSALRKAKSGDVEEKEAFEKTLGRIIASFYGEDPSTMDQLKEWTKNLVTDVDDNKPPLLQKWDEMINVFDELQTEHQDLVERVEEVEDELEREEEEHHTA